MKTFLAYFLLFIFIGCDSENPQRLVIDFNHDWKFSLKADSTAHLPSFDDSDWINLNVPHDWSIEAGYRQDSTAASTGFVPGGIGWYRKSFRLDRAYENKKIRILFDGVYNNSTVWVNGHKLGFRPSGYSSFAYDLTDHLFFNGDQNYVSVRVDRQAYADSRWYTGSGIYRNVKLIVTGQEHFEQWGHKITTRKITKERAKVEIQSDVIFSDNALQPDKYAIRYTVRDSTGGTQAEFIKNLSGTTGEDPVTEIDIHHPNLWSVESPYLYQLQTSLYANDQLIDVQYVNFGIREAYFDADRGFFLNNIPLKIKGVNLHHDAGAVGAAVPKSLWRYRIKKLKSIGTNAIRLSHNPHSPELIEVCDEEGMLVIAEAFDEWDRPKGKSLVYLGDNAAPEFAARAYPEHFDEWAERDLKDMVKRDFNHPCIILWSIGNEIEWTFPHYSKTYADVNGPDKQYYKHTPVYDPDLIRLAFASNSRGSDTLSATARKLANWVREVDPSRPITVGSVHPSIAMASGYGSSVDVLGFNYRAVEYDKAHQQYPNLKIYGSENWGSYQEWKDCLDRDFVAGIFLWTGFAYLGESGPWPRKGLNIALFDYAGFKNPRGHFFECLWTEKPKAYMVTTPLASSEFSYDEKTGWTFDMKMTPPPVWQMLRKWEWYNAESKWQYEMEEPIVVQAYTNCDQAELFLNGESLGRQRRADFSTDNIIKWLVPYSPGELKLVAYDSQQPVDTYYLHTFDDRPANISLTSSCTSLQADGYDVAVITAQLVDKSGFPIVNDKHSIEFTIEGPGRNIGVDNGWEFNTQPHKSNRIITRDGKAIIIVQATTDAGQIIVNATSGDIKSTMSLNSL